MNSPRTFSITFTTDDGDTITTPVTAIFCRGWAGTREDPPEPDSAEISAVIHPAMGHNMIDELSDSELERIESEWIEAWHDEERAHIDSINDEKQSWA